MYIIQYINMNAINILYTGTWGANGTQIHTRVQGV